MAIWPYPHAHPRHPLPPVPRPAEMTVSAIAAHLDGLGCDYAGVVEHLTPPEHPVRCLGLVAEFRTVSRPAPVRRRGLEFQGTEIWCEAPALKERLG